MPRTKKPAPVAWCDEHHRYFFWKFGCTREGKPAKEYPTGEQVRAYYDWAKTGLA